MKTIDRVKILNFLKEHSEFIEINNKMQAIYKQRHKEDMVQ
jgi:hypothetical protein